MCRYLKLYSSCFLVDGHSMCLLLDTERENIYDIPKPIYDLLKGLVTTSYESFLNENYNDREYIKSVVDQFIKEELAYFTSSPQSFPDINLDWPSPYLILNSVIHIKDLKTYDVYKTLKDIESMGCQHFQIIVESNLSILEIEKIISFFENSRVKHIELLLPESFHNSVNLLENLILAYPRLAFVIIYNVKENKIIKEIQGGRFIEFCERDVRFKKEEIISLQRFSKNLQVYIESQSFNVGLNNKVTIMSDGNIMNYSSHDMVYGNVNEDVLQQVVKSDVFLEKWIITNDKIEKCKDCQYRYICVNNSDIYEERGSFYRKEICDFDPYTNSWK